MIYIIPWCFYGGLLLVFLYVYYTLVWCPDGKSGSGLNFLDFKWLKSHSDMKIIGIIFHLIIYNLLCPIITIIYWIYRLFTFEV